MSTDKIPLVDLRKIHDPLRAEFHAALDHILDGSGFIGGSELQNFEKEFAAFCGVQHAIGCANGTDALEIIILSLLGRGNGTEEIITSAHTFIATGEAISRSGYRPVFVDIDERTGLMDLSLLEAKISTNTKAIVPVHLYGQMVDMKKLMAFAQSKGLKVIEDSAQAHGALSGEYGPGQLGDAASFSFFPGKNLGALGDGGAIVTNNLELAKRIRMQANHGRLSKYEHAFEGQNSRLDGLQAAFLRLKLRHLGEWIQQRRELAASFSKRLQGHPGITLPCEMANHRHSYHLYVVQVDRRDEILEALKRDGIEAGVHYPVPLHLQPAYKYLGLTSESLPITVRAAQRILSLPVFPGMTEAQVDRVCERLIHHVNNPTGSLANREPLREVTP